MRDELSIFLVGIGIILFYGGGSVAILKLQDHRRRQRHNRKESER